MHKFVNYFSRPMQAKIYPETTNEVENGHQCCMSDIALVNQEGKLCSLFNKRYIHTHIKEVEVLVSLSESKHSIHWGLSDVVWKKALWHHHQKFTDGTSVKFDAIFFPDTNTYQVLLVWVGQKPKSYLLPCENSKLVLNHHSDVPCAFTDASKEVVSFSLDGCHQELRLPNHILNTTMKQCQFFSSGRINAHVVETLTNDGNDKYCHSFEVADIITSSSPLAKRTWKPMVCYESQMDKKSHNCHLVFLDVDITYDKPHFTCSIQNEKMYLVIINSFKLPSKSVFKAHIFKLNSTYGLAIVLEHNFCSNVISHIASYQMYQFPSCKCFSILNFRQSPGKSPRNETKKVDSNKPQLEMSLDDSVVTDTGELLEIANATEGNLKTAGTNPMMLASNSSKHNSDAVCLFDQHAKSSVDSDLSTSNCENPEKLTISIHESKEMEKNCSPQSACAISLTVDDSVQCLSKRSSQEFEELVKHLNNNNEFRDLPLEYLDKIYDEISTDTRTSWSDQITCSEGQSLYLFSNIKSFKEFRVLNNAKIIGTSSRCALLHSVSDHVQLYLICSVEILDKVPLKEGSQIVYSTKSLQSSQDTIIGIGLIALEKTCVLQYHSCQDHESQISVAVENSYIKSLIASSAGITASPCPTGIDIGPSFDDPLIGTLRLQVVVAQVIGFDDKHLHLHVQSDQIASPISCSSEQVYIFGIDKWVKQLKRGEPLDVDVFVVMQPSTVLMVYDKLRANHLLHMCKKHQPLVVVDSSLPNGRLPFRDPVGAVGIAEEKKVKEASLNLSSNVNSTVMHRHFDATLDTDIFEFSSVITRENIFSKLRSAVLSFARSLTLIPLENIYLLNNEDINSESYFDINLKVSVICVKLQKPIMYVGKSIEYFGICTQFDLPVEHREEAKSFIKWKLQQRCFPSFENELPISIAFSQGKLTAIGKIVVFNHNHGYLKFLLFGSVRCYAKFSLDVLSYLHPKDDKNYPTAEESLLLCCIASVKLSYQNKGTSEPQIVATSIKVGSSEEIHQYVRNRESNLGIHSPYLHGLDHNDHLEQDVVTEKNEFDKNQSPSVCIPKTGMKHGNQNSEIAAFSTEMNVAGNDIASTIMSQASAHAVQTYHSHSLESSHFVDSKSISSSPKKVCNDSSKLPIVPAAGTQTEEMSLGESASSVQVHDTNCLLKKCSFVSIEKHFAILKIVSAEDEYVVLPLWNYFSSFFTENSSVELFKRDVKKCIQALCLPIDDPLSVASYDVHYVAIYAFAGEQPFLLTHLLSKWKSHSPCPKSEVEIEVVNNCPLNDSYSNVQSCLAKVISIDSKHGLVKFKSSDDDLNFARFSNDQLKDPDGNMVATTVPVASIEDVSMRSCLAYVQKQYKYSMFCYKVQEVLLDSESASPDYHDLSFHKVPSSPNSSKEVPSVDCEDFHSCSKEQKFGPSITSTSFAHSASTSSKPSASLTSSKPSTSSTSSEHSASSTSFEHSASSTSSEHSASSTSSEHSASTSSAAASSATHVAHALPNYSVNSTLSTNSGSCVSSAITKNSKGSVMVGSSGNKVADIVSDVVKSIIFESNEYACNQINKFSSLKRKLATPSSVIIQHCGLLAINLEKKYGTIQMIGRNPVFVLLNKVPTRLLKQAKNGQEPEAVSSYIILSKLSCDGKTLFDGFAFCVFDKKKPAHLDNFVSWIKSEDKHDCSYYASQAIRDVFASSSKSSVEKKQNQICKDLPQMNAGLERSEISEQPFQKVLPNAVQNGIGKEKIQDVLVSSINSDSSIPNSLTSDDDGNRGKTKRIPSSVEITLQQKMDSFLEMNNISRNESNKISADLKRSHSEANINSSKLSEQNKLPAEKKNPESIVNKVVKSIILDSTDEAEKIVLQHTDVKEKLSLKYVVSGFVHKGMLEIHKSQKYATIETKQCRAFVPLNKIPKELLKKLKKPLTSKPLLVSSFTIDSDISISDGRFSAFSCCIFEGKKPIYVGIFQEWIDCCEDEHNCSSFICEAVERALSPLPKPTDAGKDSVIASIAKSFICDSFANTLERFPDFTFKKQSSTGNRVQIANGILNLHLSEGYGSAQTSFHTILVPLNKVPDKYVEMAEKGSPPQAVSFYTIPYVIMMAGKKFSSLAVFIFEGKKPKSVEPFLGTIQKMDHLVLWRCIYAKVKDMVEKDCKLQAKSAPFNVVFNDKFENSLATPKMSLSSSLEQVNNLSSESSKIQPKCKASTSTSISMTDITSKQIIRNKACENKLKLQAQTSGNFQKTGNPSSPSIEERCRIVTNVLKRKLVVSNFGVYI